jgi:RHS repeat-associated protein
VGSFGGQTVLRTLTPETGAPGTLSYFLTDHLGSVVAITNDTGTLTSQQRYLPFGGVRQLSNYSTIQQTDYGYTGQRLLDSGMGGLMDYNARFYSPLLGRFIQPDSIIPDPVNPQAWNRYSYVMNRPVNLNDPTGHCIGPVIVICGEILLGLAIVTAVELTIYYVNNTSQAEELRIRAAEGIESFVEMAKKKTSKEAKRTQEIFNNMLKPVESGDINGNGPQLRRFDCEKNPFACIGLFIGSTFAIGVVIYNSIKCASEAGDKCERFRSPDLIVPSKIPTPTQALVLPSHDNLKIDPFRFTLEPTLRTQLHLLTPTSTPTPTRSPTPGYSPKKSKLLHGPIE